MQPLMFLLLMVLSAMQLAGVWWCSPPASVEVEPDQAPSINNTIVKPTPTHPPGNDPFNAIVEQTPADPPGDGTFNGVNIYYRETDPSFHSEIRCVGDNFRSNAWQSRSCEFRNMCFNTETKKYVLFQSPKNRHMGQQAQGGTTFSTTLTRKKVALGSFTLEQIEDHGFEKMRWSPEIETELPQSYYQLPSDYVFVPFHGLAPHNPGHLIWDNFLPIHTLLSTFHLQSRKRLLLMRVVLENGMFGTCEAEGQEDWIPAQCKFMLHKFLDMMGTGVNDSFSTNNDFKVTQKKSKKSKYICAKMGVAGIGMLTDHGVQSHGYNKEDYDRSNFAGRAPLIYAFRSFVMKNMGLKDDGIVGRGLPLRITFSIHSSGHDLRGTGFSKQIKAVKEAYKDNDNVVVQSFCFADYSTKEQLEIASETAIYIGAVGGGAVTATFLPPGSSTIMYYNREEGVRARLDWEILNNAGYFTSNWLEIEKRNSKEGVQRLLGIIDLEIDRIASL